MGRIIDIKLPKEYFEKDRDNSLEARLAKFPLAVGDTIRFNEWDSETDELIGRSGQVRVVYF